MFSCGHCLYHYWATNTLVDISAALCENGKVIVLVCIVLYCMNIFVCYWVNAVCVYTHSYTLFTSEGIVSTYTCVDTFGNLSV